VRPSEAVSVIADSTSPAAPDGLTLTLIGAVTHRHAQRRPAARAQPRGGAARQPAAANFFQSTVLVEW